MRRGDRKYATGPTQACDVRWVFDQRFPHGCPNSDWTPPVGLDRVFRERLPATIGKRAQLSLARANKFAIYSP